jgi:hypothetical protein
MYQDRKFAVSKQQVTHLAFCSIAARTSCGCKALSSPCPSHHYTLALQKPGPSTTDSPMRSQSVYAHACVRSEPMQPNAVVLLGLTPTPPGDLRGMSPEMLNPDAIQPAKWERCTPNGCARCSTSTQHVSRQQASP